LDQARGVKDVTCEKGEGARTIARSGTKREKDGQVPEIGENAGCGDSNMQS
jgi:hypothetical protein